MILSYSYLQFHSLIVQDTHVNQSY